METKNNLEKEVLETPEGFVRCVYDDKLIRGEEAFRSPYGRPYCNENCYIMFIED